MAGTAAEEAPSTAPDGGRWLNFYGRRHGKPLRPGQRRLLETRLPALSPAGISRLDNPERRPLDVQTLLPDARERWLEIGFGGGEHLLAQAVANPDVGIIGCEPFVNGVAMLLSAMERQPVRNVRLHAGDVRFLFEVLPPACLDRVFVLYPDPWPKARHVARRFVNAENLDSLARCMRPGADLRLATDIPAYVAHTREAVAAHPAFAVLDDAATPWADWPGTRYEAKALKAGRAPRYLTIRRATI